MTREKKRVGRPTKKAKAGERVPLGLRVTAELKSRLDDAAKRSGRSQSQEAEFRIERSFDRQDLLTEVLTLRFGETVARLLLRFGGDAQLRTLALHSLNRSVSRNEGQFDYETFVDVNSTLHPGWAPPSREEWEQKLADTPPPPTDEEFDEMLKRHTKLVERKT